MRRTASRAAHVSRRLAGGRREDTRQAAASGSTRQGQQRGGAKRHQAQEARPSSPCRAGKGWSPLPRRQLQRKVGFQRIPPPLRPAGWRIKRVASQAARQVQSAEQPGTRRARLHPQAANKCASTARSRRACRSWGCLRAAQRLTSSACSSAAEKRSCWRGSENSSQRATTCCTGQGRAKSASWGWQAARGGWQQAAQRSAARGNGANCPANPATAATPRRTPPGPGAP